MVRRDQCLATVKLQERALRILFDTRDLSLLRVYLVKQFARLLEAGAGGVSVKEFIFSKEVKLGHYRQEETEPAGAVLSRQMMTQDPMAVPPFRWRVPYVVISGLPSAPLKHLIRSPMLVMQRSRSDSPIRINGTYYVEKCVLPALERVLTLAGADVVKWYYQMPRTRYRKRQVIYPSMDGNDGHAGGEQKSRQNQTTLDSFVNRTACLVCGDDSATDKNLCVYCSGRSRAKSHVQLTLDQNKVIEKEQALRTVCQGCTQQLQPGTLFSPNEPLGGDCCSSLNCRIFYDRARHILKLEDISSALAELDW